MTPLPVLPPLLLALCLSVLAPRPSPAQTVDSEWAAFTSMSQVTDLVVGDGDIWATTTGGALHYDRATRAYHRFTRLDGLAGNRLFAVARDGAGDLWFGSDGEGLSRFRTGTSTFDPPYLEFRDLRIRSLLSDGDVLYVGTQRGISVFLVDREEVKESYRRMGNLPKDTEAVALALHDGRLFVGTADGVAWARLDQPNLQDPDSWNSLASTGPVRDVVIAGGQVHVGSAVGVFTYDPLANRFYHDMQSFGVTALGARADVVVAATEDGDFLRRSSRGLWGRIPAPVITAVRALSTTGRDDLWLGTDKGLRVIGNVTAPPPSGEPGSSRFYDLALQTDGALWAASVPDDQQRTLSAGVYQRTADGWKVYAKATGMPNDELVALETDSAGRMWVGSWGGGAMVREGNGTWTAVGHDRTVLRGVPNSESFVVVSDIQRDAAGSMWLLNELRGVAVLDGYPPQRQLLIDQVELGLGPKVDLYRMDIGPDGLKWIASRTDGLVLVDDGGTPFAAGDDRMVVLNQAAEPRLTSNRAFDVHAGADGRVWLATDNGVNVLAPEYDRAAGTLRAAAWRVYNGFDGLPSTEINVLAGDDAGNVWVGTEGGLSRIGGDGQVDVTFTQSNSGLIDNRVKGLLYDASRGELWIGTFDGLSRLGLLTAPGGEPAGPTVYPNPFVTAGRRQLRFAGLPLGAALRIYTVAGELVASLHADPGRGAIAWNGQSDAGFLVASGVYYYVADGEAGDRVRGRFAVVGGVPR